MPRYKPVFPDLIDASQVVASTDMRPIGKTSEESRAAKVKETGGAPMVDFDGKTNPYIDYQSIDLLLSLQHPRSDGYDEMCFFVMGQVKELLFRGLHFELFNARAQVQQDNIRDALEILERAGHGRVGRRWMVTARDRASVLSRIMGNARQDVALQSGRTATTAPWTVRENNSAEPAPEQRQAETATAISGSPPVACCSSRMQYRGRCQRAVSANQAQG